ncbi:fimbrial protein SthA [Budviciaceae bacterium CWB-B4]|uniref:Fimbrial protein SthA n=1 Tax=Limnobaculum xujianqingii TaxID=2738837 RepID=A0A9D7AH53_9GAMM|nr:fimbrial protein [Limnobaculum xujianqingii]MBK5072533.1 fimbrial protein SthA [Limnobaculum xujianqingii]MBK5175842.1 fimbrial protein SthA [Limnobaculum xujianqingii]
MKVEIKKVLLIAALLTAIPSSVMAGTITFKGKVIDAGCTVDVDGNTDETIDLGSTPKGDLTSAGVTGAPKSFVINLKGCPVAGTDVPTMAYVKFSGTTDGKNSYFKNSITTGATNVAVLLKDEAGNEIVNNDGNEAIAIPTTGGDIAVNYTARLVATATGVTSGDVQSVVTYTVSYN